MATNRCPPSNSSGHGSMSKVTEGYVRKGGLNPPPPSNVHRPAPPTPTNTSSKVPVQTGWKPR